MIPYTPDELEFITRTMNEQQKKAEEAAKKRGYEKDPRVEAANLK